MALVPHSEALCISTSAKTCFSLKKQEGSILLCCLFLAAEPVLSHHKQLLFLIYTSGVGSWTNFIRVHMIITHYKIKKYPMASLMFSNFDLLQL